MAAIVSLTLEARSLVCTVYAEDIENGKKMIGNVQLDFFFFFFIDEYRIHSSRQFLFNHKKKANKFSWVYIKSWFWGYILNGGRKYAKLR